MADMNETNLEIKEEPKTENTFTQADVSNVVAKNVKEERAKILKELGIEDMDNAKEALKAYKELQDKQKSDLDKIAELKAQIEAENTTLKAQLKQIETEKTLNKVLTEMQIEPGYHKAIIKLIPDAPETEKELKELITATVKEFLPNAIEIKDVGFEKKEVKPQSGTKTYLVEKYGKNPYFKG